MRKFFVLLLSSMMATCSLARTWTLEQCLQYAMENNISLQKSALTRQSATEELKASKAELLPSLTFSTSQNGAYRPWTAKSQIFVNNGQVEDSSNDISYNGSYQIAANWTVWNGNRNHNQVKLNAIAEQAATVDSVTNAKQLQEQISQFFIQILYTKEAIAVNKAMLEAARVNEDRGRQMVEVGSMSRADLSQLTAQRAQDEYNVVSAESSARNYIRQLKALLQITDEEEFDVAPVMATDEMALMPIPALQVVYDAARANRPELKRAQLDVRSAELQRRMAVAMRMPTLSLNAGVSTNTSSMGNKTWGTQIRDNVNVGAGVTVSVPIVDQRKARTAINKADIQKQTALLDIRNKETALYSTIENYWIQAYNNQSQYKAAKVSSESASESYNLLSEQFAVGLKNIVELQEGKNRLLSARQSELQSKYMTILNIKMLEFYKK